MLSFPAISIFFRESSGIILVHFNFLNALQSLTSFFIFI